VINMMLLKLPLEKSNDVNKRHESQRGEGRAPIASYPAMGRVCKKTKGSQEYDD